MFVGVMAMHLCLPSPACQPILGPQVGHQGRVVGPFAEELNCNQARVPMDWEVFGIYRDLIPAGQGGEL